MYLFIMGYLDNLARGLHLFNVSRMKLPLHLGYEDFWM